MNIQFLIKMIIKSFELNKINQKNINKTLLGINRILKKNGKFYIAVPDMDILCKMFIDKTNTPQIKIHALRMIFDTLFDRYKNKQDFIQKYIFPGGFLPNKNSINRYVSDNGLTIKSYESYADHYSNTLALWRKEFNKKWNLIKNQGFDLTFKRMWEFYLCYCEAGFKSKNIDLIQFSIQNK